MLCPAIPHHPTSPLQPPKPQRILSRNTTERHPYESRLMGAGVIGVTTAYYLAKGGAEVIVLDRQAGPGLETSYANAGELSYGMTSPWAAPGIPVKAVNGRL